MHPKVLLFHQEDFDHLMEFHNRGDVHCLMDLDDFIDEMEELFDAFDPVKFHPYWNPFLHDCSDEIEEFIP